MSQTSPLDAYIARVNQIDWQSAPAPTPHAEELLREYARRLGTVWRHLARSSGMALVDADSLLIEVGTGAPESDRLQKALQAATKGVMVWTHLAFNLHAFYFWPSDPELAAFANPFEPLLELYELGFTTAGGVSDTEPDKLEMSLGSQAGIHEYVLTP